MVSNVSRKMGGSFACWKRPTGRYGVSPQRICDFGLNGSCGTFKRTERDFLIWCNFGRWISVIE